MSINFDFSLGLDQSFLSFQELRSIENMCISGKPDGSLQLEAKGAGKTWTTLSFRLHSLSSLGKVEWALKKVIKNGGWNPGM